ncbi:MAG: N-acetylglucosamine kinase [Bacteroidales bacterium]|nr:N-acetylglucosamine kinase [Bacteroidales bacterium]
MILLADSGASKTDWACVSRENDEKYLFTSQGYNPNYITGDQIVADLQACMPAGFPVDRVQEIYFYGAGVTPLQYPFMEQTLLRVFTKATKVFIAMDTLASCRALLGTKPGFAAILGTGANSCLYDGRNEGLNIDSCGFILGDEGSGANIGKRLITDYIRHNMPENVYKLVGEKLGKNNDELLDQIYTRPFPNRFCAQYARFVQDNFDTDPYFPELVKEGFRMFFDKVVTHYPDYKSYKFNAVGSVAFFHRRYLEEVCAEYGMEVGVLMRAPMEGLIKYHIENPDV